MSTPDPDLDAAVEQLRLAAGPLSAPMSGEMDVRDLWLVMAEYDARGERIAELERELAEAREWIQDRQESDYEKRELG